MPTQKWLTIARREALPPGQMLRLEIGRSVIGLANVNGQFYAFNDNCPHQDFPLSEGVLEDCCLSCALHGWSFDLRDGHPYPPLLRPYLVTYPLKIEDDAIKISLE